MTSFRGSVYVRLPHAAVQMDHHQKSLTTTDEAALLRGIPRSASHNKKHAKLNDDAEAHRPCSCTKICQVPNLSLDTVSPQLLLPILAVLLTIVVVQGTMIYRSYAFAAAFAVGSVEAHAVKRQSGYAAPQSSATTSATMSSSSPLPDYYQTLPEFYPGQSRCKIYEMSAHKLRSYPNRPSSIPGRDQPSSIPRQDFCSSRATRDTSANLW